MAAVEGDLYLQEVIIGYGGMARKIQDGGSMADVTALVLVPLDRWRVGGPIYAIGMIDRRMWLAHGPQMCVFTTFTL